MGDYWPIYFIAIQASSNKTPILGDLTEGVMPWYVVSTTDYLPQSVFRRALAVAANPVQFRHESNIRSAIDRCQIQKPELLSTTGNLILRKTYHSLVSQVEVLGLDDGTSLKLLDKLDIDDFENFVLSAMSLAE